MAIHITDVITKLEKILKEEGNLEVCRVGHFGEINEMSLYSISTCNADIPDYESIKMGGVKTRRVVDLETPDIGPDPD